MAYNITPTPQQLGSGFQMISPFASHNEKLWDEEMRLYSKINDSAGNLKDRIKAIDDWYGILKLMRSRIMAFLPENDLPTRRMQRYINEIRDLTGGKDLTQVPLTEEQIIEIKEKLEAFREYYFEVAGNNDLLLPKKKFNDPNMVW